MATYHIQTISDLQNIENDMNGYYYLMSDLDLTGLDWKPLGASPATTLEFTGTLDGQGYKISNMTISAANHDLEGAAGLFAFIGNDTGSPSGAATIKDLHMENIDITGYYAMGSVAGFIIAANIDGVHIKNVNMHGDPVGASGYFDSVGGLGGDCFGGDYVSRGGPNMPSSITNCTVDGFNSPGGICVGGFLGDYYYMGSDYNGFTIDNCSAVNVNITVDKSVYQYHQDVGGFSGYGDGYVHKCYAEGSISGNINGVDFVGGFIGRVHDGEVLDCYTTVVINQDIDVMADCIGGFTGCLWGSGIIQNCYSAGDVTLTGDFSWQDQQGAGGFIGYWTDGELRNCYSVGLVSSSSDEYGGIFKVGGFMGTSYPDPVLNNCSWYTGSYYLAIGNISPSGSISWLEPSGYGTDESILTRFYSTSHPVYAQEPEYALRDEDGNIMRDDDGNIIIGE